MKYVVKYTLKGSSYYKHMSVVGPAFGASLDETPRFDSREQALDTYRRFPLLAAVLCDIEEIEE